MMLSFKRWLKLSMIGFTIAASGGSARAGLGFEPGDTLGEAFAAPLPEGVFFLDNEAYGRRDRDADHGGGLGVGTAGPGPNIGVNEPILIYATPITFYNTRLQIIFASTFVHFDGGPFGGLTNRAVFTNQNFGPQLSHDFGGGFSGSILLNVRPPAEALRNSTFAEIRGGLSYTANGYDITGVLGYTGTFGGYAGGFSGHSPIPGIADAINFDFTATRKFGQFEAGFVGNYFTDINTRGDNSIQLASGQIASIKQSALAVGGLVGYDFGRFAIQAYALRTVVSRNQLITATGGQSNPETRGFLRLEVPLYLAPAANAPPSTPIRVRY